MITVISISCIVNATTIPDLDNIDSYSKEELLELQTLLDTVRTKISTRLRELDTDYDVLFDESGLKIEWIGFDTSNKSNFKNSMLVTNQTDIPIFFEIDRVAYNGIQVAMSNSFEYEIGSGLSFVTSSNNCWLVHYDDLELGGITSIDDITDVYMDIIIKDGDSYKSNVLASFNLQFSVD